MDLQIPLMIIDRRVIPIMSMLFANRRVAHLRFANAFEWIQNNRRIIGQLRDYFVKHQHYFKISKGYKEVNVISC
jgi:hypothetical protein